MNVERDIKLDDLAKRLNCNRETIRLAHRYHRQFSEGYLAVKYCQQLGTFWVQNPPYEK
jgi:hypothetical protein